MITTGGRERPQPGKRNVSITTPPPPPTPASDARSAAFPASAESSARDAAVPRRRSLLLGGGALGAVALLSGCSDDAEPRRDTGGEAAVALLRARGARDSTALLARYDATVDAHPDLAERLAPLREETARHAAVFTTKDRSASPSATASRSPSAGGQRVPKVPEDEKQALSALAQAERRTADTRTAALATAPPELARLLASVAACGAAHVYLLTQRGTDS
ncbi:ferritin-like domain-containing protein [Streptomyces yatensis]|uniref:ferritin-like domain-containing protein n=1 Tax=Streptomyces yatensis TaxID=155177 RepID=UPI0031DD2134